MSSARYPTPYAALAAEQVWFHGTRHDALDLSRSKELYLTNDFGQAWDYAHGVHLGGSGSGVPRVCRFKLLKFASVFDADPLIDAEMEGYGEIEHAIDAGVLEARKKGKRYVHFTHPSTENARGECHDVRVSLHPKDDLRFVGSEIKLRPR